MYGNLGDYDETDIGGATANGIYHMMASAAEIDSALDDIQSAVEVLEGNMAAGADRTDVLSMKEVYEYIATVENFSPKFSQRLPALMSLPGVVSSRQLLNDWYCRGIQAPDTKGVGNDEVAFFPVVNLSDLGNLVPLKGWGSANDLKNFTLIGGWKFASCVADVADGTYVDEKSGVVARLHGTSKPMHAAGPVPVNYVYTYTREDKDETIEDIITDFGDGAGIRAFYNTEHPSLRHIYSQWLFACQLAGSQEYHFLDRVPTDYEIWIDPDHYGEQYAIQLATAFGVPYLV
jgi:hypothetical protein